MNVLGFNLEELSKVKTIGDLTPLLSNKKRYTLGNGSCHYYNGMTKKYLEKLPKDWIISTLHDGFISFAVGLEEFDTECGKLLEARGWMKDEYGFYSIKK